ncbi:bifunctional diaminohydroxyphosphoribosylaminopyrimidine deaminase/5-amino-6-(5-phosphoribosylamino)uracil reductase RibD [Endozoicomonas sp. 8E]|uniref:bifunctional diaminohydroxyphosphoribosylaminopyrimidine deaminase/5-amino-6-(5-phosphoribosylamino)uracil reductase RibD n=1 Tax=Endozoicomonas sp. 8E TaxID=3035692 RepID=UPI002938E636|nr:bifunctional diaminohydroxyphosphoribosylaminopyrimidine deaminase/5-amino-6-(5-phosphoribosylamino)uracil reductase RibD [Endozoicomonas sp. 8E]WOG27306.1 bifunctional diaminohydroxyphosphoribosylaminopyrimidine deaminase/5-amino-6-(5-phosphoribosylamino)uracil reductase RibD [Endozoicomonas sp. 8E]
MASAIDHEMMSRALQLARKGLYTAMPNPRVGCVIVKDGVIVGEGFHERCGEPHAEVHALEMAGDQAEGATAYVTLEPCNHFGKTPPCAEALIKAKVSRVVAAMEDPNPMVSGLGLKRLSDVGIEVESGVLEAEARALNPGFIKKMESGQPFVRLKLAMSLDGRTAMASGESQWITGPAARSEVQKLRAQSCAVITGVGSILHDNSSLTVRAEELGLPDAEKLARRQPLRVVLDSSLQTPVNAKVVTGPGRALIVCTDQAEQSRQAELEAAGAEVIRLNAGRQVDLNALMSELAQRNCQEVLLETGATLAGSAVSEGLVDELNIFMAPILMGSEARTLLNLPFQSMSEKLSLNISDIRAIGDDWLIKATFKQNTDY